MRVNLNPSKQRQFCRITEGRKMSEYQELGFNNRREYLQSLSDEYGIELSEIIAVAQLLGKNEDFDGLVIFCEDRAN